MKGMPKDRVLDAVCEVLAEIRDTTNDNKKRENEQKSKAAPRMKDKRFDTYVAHGIRLTLSSIDKLTVNVVKDAVEDVAETDDEVAGAEDDGVDLPDNDIEDVGIGEDQ